VQELREMLCGLAEVIDAIACPRLAVDPAEDRPSPQVPVIWPALGERFRNGEWKARREPREQPQLFVEAVFARDHWQPDRHVVAKLIHRMHRSHRLDAPEREVRPPGELARQELSDERRRDLDLVVVHLVRRHRGPISVVTGV
jgi:hypothetical protein